MEKYERIEHLREKLNKSSKYQLIKIFIYIYILFIQFILICSIQMLIIVV